MRSNARTAVALLLLLPSMTACCRKQVSREDIDPRIVTVHASEILTATEADRAFNLPAGSIPDGFYVVSDGWLIRRLEQEQACVSALAKCEDDK